MALSDFRGVDELHVDTHAGRHADVMFVGIDLGGRMRQAHAAGDMVGNRIVGVSREFAV